MSNTGSMDLMKGLLIASTHQIKLSREEIERIWGVIGATYQDGEPEPRETLWVEFNGDEHAFLVVMAERLGVPVGPKNKPPKLLPL